MQAAFILSYVANMVLATVSLFVLPEQTAIHFGLGGAPGGWASSRTSTLLMLAMHTVVFCALYVSPRLLTSVPRRWINLPNRDYWLQPAHRAQAVAKFRRHLWRFGTVLFVFMFLIGLLTLRANLSDPVRLDERLFLIALGVYLLYTVYWTVSLLRAFRVPKRP